MQLLALSWVFKAALWLIMEVYVRRVCAASAAVCYAFHRPCHVTGHD